MTLPTAVQLVIDGEVVSEVSIDGPFLLPEGEVRLTGRGAGFARLELVPGSGPGRVDEAGRPLPDVPVGKVPIVSRHPTTGTVEVAPLRIPAPAPFNDAAIDLMWQSLVGLPHAVRDSVRRSGYWEAEGEATPSESDLYIPALPAVLGEAVHLLHNWPQREAQTTFVRPVDIPGGREDARATTRRIDQMRSIRLEGRVAPQMSIRRVADTTPWQLGAVSLVSFEAGRRLQALGADHELATALVPSVLSIAQRAQPTARVTDPPASSWPWPLRSFYRRVVALLAAVSAGRHREGHSTPVRPVDAV